MDYKNFTIIISRLPDGNYQCTVYHKDGTVFQIARPNSQKDLAIADAMDAIDSEVG